MDGDAGVLVRVLSVLGRDGVALGGHGLSGIYVAVLQDHCRVAEYEVYRPVNVAFAIELAQGVDVERVLVSENFAPVDHSVVCAYAQSHGLVLAWSSVVLECNVPGYETTACSRCRSKQKREQVLS